MLRDIGKLNAIIHPDSYSSLKYSNVKDSSNKDALKLGTKGEGYAIKSAHNQQDSVLFWHSPMQIICTWHHEEVYCRGPSSLWEHTYDYSSSIALFLVSYYDTKPINYRETID